MIILKGSKSHFFVVVAAVIVIMRIDLVTFCCQFEPLERFNNSTKTVGCGVSLF